MAAVRTERPLVQASYWKDEHTSTEAATMLPEEPAHESLDFQRFLDSHQYTAAGILRYERVFGSGFVSPGGMETTEEFVKMLDLKAGQRVLDVGCGIGGSGFYMAEEFGVDVLGINLSVNMISLGLEPSRGRRCAVEFEIADCTTINYPDASFDVIYSRDTILHIQDKPALFSRSYKWLKPGGRVLITDYCRAASTPSPETAAYIQQRGYDLHSVHAYGQMLQAAGFVDVLADDRTAQNDYSVVVSGWENKLKRCSNDEQKWGLFVAHKPL